jgi:hypothetical protein
LRELSDLLSDANMNEVKGIIAGIKHRANGFGGGAE